MPVIFPPNSTLTATLLRYPSWWTGSQTVLLPSPGPNHKAPLWPFLACLRLLQEVTPLYTPSGACVCMLAGVARKSEHCLVHWECYPPLGILFSSVDLSVNIHSTCLTVCLALHLCFHVWLVRRSLSRSNFRFSCLPPLQCCLLPWPSIWR